MQARLNLMLKFEIGNIYACRSICNYDCVWYFRVVSRTKSTITILKDDEKNPVVKRINKQLSECNGAESVYPLGNYSMAPVLSADDSAFKIALS